MVFASLVLPGDALQWLFEKTGLCLAFGDSSGG